VTLSGVSAVSVWGFSLSQRGFGCGVVVSVVLGFGSLLWAQAPSETAPAKPLPPGPVQAKIKAACTQCHNASRITEQHLTAKQWSDQLDKMVGLGAEVQDTDREAILRYLTKNFGPIKGVKSAVKKAGDGAN
jgi:hypothetical protein